MRTAPILWACRFTFIPRCSSLIPAVPTPPLSISTVRHLSGNRSCLDSAKLVADRGKEGYKDRRKERDTGMPRLNLASQVSVVLVLQPQLHATPKTPSQTMNLLNSRLIPAQNAIDRLRAYKPPPTNYDLVPLSRRAAVLILLYADSKGDLRVVLTIRASTLSSCMYSPIYISIAMWRCRTG